MGPAQKVPFSTHDHNDPYHPVQVKTALVNKDLKKAGEMEIKKLDQLLSQVFVNDGENEDGDDYDDD